MEDKTEAQAPKWKVTRTEDYVNVYANNVGFEATTWDLKMNFGQIEQSEGTVNVEQHTAITMAWTEAKVFAYLLLGSIMAFESQNGKINIPAEGRPNALPAFLANETNPKLKELHTELQKLYTQLIADS